MDLPPRNQLAVRQSNLDHWGMGRSVSKDQRTTCHSPAGNLSPSIMGRNQETMPLLLMFHQRPMLQGYNLQETSAQ